MKNHFKNIFSLLFCSFFISHFIFPVFGNQTELKFKHISAADGLSNSFVYCELSDTKGFMWFGTMQGLNRFDGYNCKVYTSNTADSLSISNDIIQALFEYTEGIFLIGTNNGLNLFNAKEEKFHRYFHNPNDTGSIIGSHIFTIKRDGDNDIWIGTDKGLCLCHIDLDKEHPQLTFSVPPKNQL